jgi:urease accessory protein
MTAIDLLRSIQHADSGFPNGGFAFSQGLEGFAGMGARPSGEDIDRFIRTLVVLRWMTADRIALVRAYRAAEDLTAIAMLDQEVEASTSVEALRAGSRRNGMAFLTAHMRLGTPRAAAYRAMVQTGAAPGHLAVAQGLLWSAIGVSEQAAIAMSGYSHVSALATAAVRLGLLGAIDAQRMVSGMLHLVADAAAAPVADGERMCSYTPFAEMAAMRHARQPTRLFFN